MDPEQTVEKVVQIQRQSEAVKKQQVTVCENKHVKPSIEAIRVRKIHHKQWQRKFKPVLQPPSLYHMWKGKMLVTDVGRKATTNPSVVASLGVV